VVLLPGAAVPIALTCLRWLPFPKYAVSRFKATLVDPSMIGSHHRFPWLQTLTVPTRSQALFIAYLIVINIVISFADYTTVMPNSWYSTTSSQLANFIASRTGVLGVATLASLILYSSRNNFLF
jgi:hypothetical protein